MDKSIRNFLRLAGMVLTGMLIMAGVLVCFYLFSTISTYNYILLFSILLILLLVCMFIAGGLIILFAYRGKHIQTWLLRPTSLGLRLLMPVFMAAAPLARLDKDDIRRFYVKFNNTVVNSMPERYKPGDILVLLPHCLQNKDCKYKITGNIENCRHCGRCCIGEITDIVHETGVKTAVVTGGTAARNLVANLRPQVILSVACERDLTSGIMDVGSIPVIGIFNERPEGPCTNTTLDVARFREKLYSLLDMNRHRDGSLVCEAKQAGNMK